MSGERRANLEKKERVPMGLLTVPNSQSRLSSLQKITAPQTVGRYLVAVPVSFNLPAFAGVKISDAENPGYKNLSNVLQKAFYRRDRATRLKQIFDGFRC